MSDLKDWKGDQLDPRLIRWHYRLECALVANDLERTKAIVKQRYPLAAHQVDAIAANHPEQAVEWIARSYNLGSGFYPEDRHRYQEAWNFHQANKNNPRFHEHADLARIAGIGERNPRNPLHYTLHEMEHIQDKMRDADRERAAQEELPRAPIHGSAKIIHDSPTHTILRIGHDIPPPYNPMLPYVSGRKEAYEQERNEKLSSAADAACQYASGTRWCTARKEAAEYYLGQSPLHVIYEKRPSGAVRRIAQLHFSLNTHHRQGTYQLADLRDRIISPDEGWRHLLTSSGLINHLTAQAMAAHHALVQYHPEIMEKQGTPFPAKHYEGIGASGVAEYERSRHHHFHAYEVNKDTAEQLRRYAQPYTFLPEIGHVPADKLPVIKQYLSTLADAHEALANHHYARAGFGGPRIGGFSPTGNKWTEEARRKALETRRLKKRQHEAYHGGASGPKVVGRLGTPEEQAHSRKLALAKIRAAPIPSPEAVAKAREELKRNKRAGGTSRGGGSKDRKRQRQNLFKEWGGNEKGYVVCPWSGICMHWSKDKKHNPEGHPVFERGKIFTKKQGGGYQLPNLLPESYEANRKRNKKTLRHENLEED
jgi:hypothetical protein